MNIEAIKLELMQLLLNTTSESTLIKIRRIYQEDSTDWWMEMSLEEKVEVEEGLKQIEKGEVVNHENVMKRFDAWK